MGFLPSHFSWRDCFSDAAQRRETPTQGEASSDRIAVVCQQNEFKQQVGLVSFTTDVSSLCRPDCSEEYQVISQP